MAEYFTAILLARVIKQRSSNIIKRENNKIVSIYLSYFYSLLIIIGLEVSLLKPDFFWWALFALLIGDLFFIWLATHRKFNMNFFNFLISPFLFMLGGLLFLLFLDSFFLKEIIIIFLLIASSVFLRRLIVRNYYQYDYKNHSLSGISRILNMSIVFFFFGAFFNLHSFMRFPIWMLVFFSYLVVGLTVYQYFCISKIRSGYSGLFILFSSLMLAELFYVINWLPFLSHTKALLMVSAYYFIINLARHYLVGTLARQVYARYSFVTGLIWVVAFVSSRWT